VSARPAFAAPAFKDWLDICTLKARYCRLLDTKDWAGWRALFTDDFVLDTSPAGGLRIAGADAAVAYVRSSITDDTTTTHHVHNPEIMVTGDTATAVWAMQDRNLWPNGRTLLGFGHYHERYRREGDPWKIAESKLTRLNTEMTG
jgi:3-phenylpropionate/cinnamic acid dioxygenase small subunit